MNFGEVPRVSSTRGSLGGRFQQVRREEARCFDEFLAIHGVAAPIWVVKNGDSGGCHLYQIVAFWPKWLKTWKNPSEMSGNDVLRPKNCFANTALILLGRLGIGLHTPENSDTRLGMGGK